MAPKDALTETTSSRRRLLAGLGATSAMSLAGCSGLGLGGGNQSDNNQGGNNQNLGERVPNITMRYFSSLSILEDSAPPIQQSLSDRLGLSVQPKPTQISSLVESLYADKRTTLMPMYRISEVVDPNVSLSRWTVDSAGSGIAGVGNNISNFTDCKYTFFAYEQPKYTGKNRKKIVSEAQGVASNQLPFIPYMTGPSISVWRDDQVDMGGVGPNTPGTANVRSFTETTTKKGTDTIHSSGTPFAYETVNFFTLPDQAGPWNNIIHSPLKQRTPDYETENDLAESISLEKDNTRVVVSLKPSATFHNGDKVTAGDVKYTYEFLLAGGEAGVFPGAPTDLPLDSIETIDEETVAYNLKNAYSPLVQRDFPLWGILHRKTWEAVNAMEQPGNATPETPFVGSGPYRLESFEVGQSLYMEPYADHHMYSPTASAQITPYTNGQTEVQALKGGTINMATNVSSGNYEQLRQEDYIGSKVAPNIMTTFLAPNMAAAPTKFPEFRKAVAAALNRQVISQLAAGGLVDPVKYATLYSKAHPFRAPDDKLYRMADSPTGSKQAARSYLSEAGWGWDGNGNLHYPPDADLTPQWKSGGTPDPSKFDCLNQEGYTRPDGYELPI